MLARPGLPSFDYVRPRTLDEVTRLMDEHGEAARLLMGGTDVFVRMRDGSIRPKIVVDVKHLPGMRDIVYDEQGGLTVGAAVTMNQLASHPEVQTHYPLLAAGAQDIADGQDLHVVPRGVPAGEVRPGAPEHMPAPLRADADEPHRDPFAGRHGGPQAQGRARRHVGCRHGRGALSNGMIIWRPQSRPRASRQRRRSELISRPYRQHGLSELGRNSRAFD